MGCFSLCSNFKRTSISERTNRYKKKRVRFVTSTTVFFRQAKIMFCALKSQNIQWILGHKKVITCFSGTFFRK